MIRLRLPPPKALAVCAGLVLLSAGAIAAVLEARYADWHPVVSPLDADPLVIRRDAKGDGRFQAPRSGNRKHRGVDIAAELKSPVRALRSGRVLESGFHKGLGWYVVVQHREGLRSLYAHLFEAGTPAGRRVRQGEVIGRVGKTGNAKHAWITPHLHLEVTDVETKSPIDPGSLGLQLTGAPRTTGGGPGSDARGGD
jgi:murein DD-endopeptidase MepM/ murein hydrolase activator NlpD